MKVFEHKFAERIINSILSEQFLDLKPVIAGGFVAALYKNIIMPYSKELEKSFELHLDYLKIIEESHLNSGVLAEFLKLFSQFNDIDTWFLDSSPIWDNGSVENSIVRRYSSKVDNEHIRNYDFKNIIGDYKPLSSTYWANTFLVQNTRFTRRNINLQLIRKKISSIEGLFSTFDIANCCIAFYDGKFYVSERAANAFNENEIMLNGEDPYKNYSFARKIYSAQRIFKYSARYCLPISHNACELVTKIMLDSNAILYSVKDEISDSELADLLVDEGLDHPYGMRNSVNYNRLKYSIKMLNGYATLLFSMPSFNKNYLFLFLNFKDPLVVKYLSDYFDKQ